MDSPARPGPQLWGNIEEGLDFCFFSRFCDVEVKSWGIAEDNQIDVSCFKETSYAFYESVKIAYMAECIVCHYCFFGGIFEQVAACIGHFPASYADEFDIVSAFL